GYQQMRTEFYITTGRHQATVNLDPVSEPPEVKNMDLLKSHPDAQLIRGYVSDSVSHKPLAGVRVHLERSGAETATNERGYFEILEFTNSPERPIKPEDLPETDTLIATAPEYKTSVFSQVILVRGGDSTLQIEMERGAGTVEHR